MSRIEFDPSMYYKYDELVTLMHQWAEDYPELTKLYSIGKTYEGRDMWLIELTNKETGCSEDKPAYYIDANFHAGEVTGCATAMYTINHLLTTYGECKDTTRILDETAVYVLPRVSCDGAELYLTTPMMLRSSVRPYPFEEEQPGLHIKDVNGDGFITQMRIVDPNGDWKVSEDDPRLMVRRRPDDIDGTFYKVHREGEIKDYDGFEVKDAVPKMGLDINRNSPVNWKPEFEQKGAGPYPFSEPETRNVAEFVLSHKNIAGMMSYHTMSGVHLRPSAQRADKDMIKEDVTMWKEIGERGSEYTGYPHVNTFEEFVSSPQTGIFMDWAYENEGILSWSTELWDLWKRAGIEFKKFKDRANRTLKEQEEDALKLLKWNDEVHGDGFVDWQPFEHPQLGKVEIGGFKTKYFRQNPPRKLLEEVVEGNVKFTLVHIKALPKLNIGEVKVDKVSENFYKITAVVENKGYQPTSGTKLAEKIKTIEAVKASVCLPEEACLTFGDKEVDMGHMAGWSKKKAEWMIKAETGTEVTVMATSDRGGKKKVKVTLE